MEATLPEMLLAGLKLMLIGMGIVFLFLALLVWIIGITARLVKGYLPQPDRNPRSALTETDEAELVAVIGTAIRRRHGG